jgi:hypothetical protein
MARRIVQEAVARPFERREGARFPKTVHEVRLREVNTQRFAAGARGGTTTGQGPALDAT